MARCFRLLVLAISCIAGGGAAAQDCRLPEGSIVAGTGPGSPDLSEGSRICVRQAGRGCFGCESGFVHVCRNGEWRPLRQEPCSPTGERPGSGAGVSAQAPAVPFRYCRHYDASGVEVRVPESEVEAARASGLVAESRCETVLCRLFDKRGEPVVYSADDGDAVRADLAAGRIALRASDCVSAGGGKRR